MSLEIKTIDFVKTDNKEIQLCPIQPSEEYCREWNVDMTDFVALTKGGELISNSLYRVGGFGVCLTDNYFMLLKYVEAIYDFDFIKKCYPEKSNEEVESSRKYLEGVWCIFDKNGVEKKEFHKFTNVYLKKNSCIYSVGNKYYNIETGELYCNSSSLVESSEFLFIENKYDKDLSRRGVMKINKKDGSWCVFS